MPEQATPTDETVAAVETSTAEVAETAAETNPHSDLPAAVELPPEERPLPFGVYRGK